MVMTAKDAPIGNWRVYRNGNYIVKLNLEDGTRIRETEDDEFISSFATNQDIKICNRCDIGCPFCHEGSTPDGKLGDIMNKKFLDTLHPYQEVALGGGNVFEHPDLIPFLKKLKEKNVIPNITLNQIHFMKEFDLVKELVKEKLVYGVGVSLVNPTEEFISAVKCIPNVVVHVINGIFSKEDYKALADNNLKLLVLGYKDLRRGVDWHEKDEENIYKKQIWLTENIEKVLKSFKVVSFDNLAIEQLDIRSHLSDEEWERFYAGDEGTSTFYIDLVEEKFALNSTAPFDKRYDLLDSVDDMFNIIRNEDSKGN